MGDWLADYLDWKADHPELDNETRNDVTTAESLARKVRAVGGVWETQRAVTAFHDAGYGGDQRQQERRARKAMRDLAKTCLLIKIQDRPVQYRTNEK